MSLMQNSPSGFSDEGTITAVPTSVAVQAKDIYKFLVDTSAGDIDFSAIAAMTGVNQGATLHFKKATSDVNAILFTDADTGAVVRFETLSDVLSLTFNGTTFDLIG